MAKRDKTNELPGMPEMDEAGKIADRLIAVSEQISEAYDERAELEDQLVELLRKRGERSIRINHTTLSLKHVKAHDKIAIKKDKE